MSAESHRLRSSFPGSSQKIVKKKALVTPCLLGKQDKASQANIIVDMIRGGRGTAGGNSLRRLAHLNSTRKQALGNTALLRDRRKASQQPTPETSTMRRSPRNAESSLEDDSDISSKPSSRHSHEDETPKTQTKKRSSTRNGKATASPSSMSSSGADSPSNLAASLISTSDSNQAAGSPSDLGTEMIKRRSPRNIEKMQDNDSQSNSDMGMEEEETQIIASHSEVNVNDDEDVPANGAKESKTQRKKTTGNAGAPGSTVRHRRRKHRPVLNLVSYKIVKRPQTSLRSSYYALQKLKNETQSIKGSKTICRIDKGVELERFETKALSLWNQVRSLRFNHNPEATDERDETIKKLEEFIEKLQEEMESNEKSRDKERVDLSNKKKTKDDRSGSKVCCFACDKNQKASKRK